MSSADLANGWPSMRVVERAPHAPRLPRVGAHEQRSELRDARRASRPRTRARRTRRAAPSRPTPDEAVVALEHDDRGVEPVLGLVAAAVRAVAERLQLPVGGDADDAHAARLPACAS